MKRLTAILLCTLAYGAATAADGWDAPADQHVNTLHRLPARATSYSYKTRRMHWRETAPDHG